MWNSLPNNVVHADCWILQQNWINLGATRKYIMKFMIIIPNFKEPEAEV